jgi:L-2-hydroxyglutarate oxidase
MAGGREQRRKGQISLRTSAENLLSPAVRKLTRRHFHTALWEQRRSFSRELFALTVQRLVPAVTKQDLQRAPAGTQPFAVRDDGTFQNDFVFAETARTFHVLSVANGGGTACLSIGRTIARQLS